MKVDMKQNNTIFAVTMSHNTLPNSKQSNTIHVNNNWSQYKTGGKYQ